jgi:hypothetical protein
MPIFQSGQLNTTALAVPDLYIQIVPPSVRLLNGVPTNVAGVVGTATWGPVNSPVPFSTYDDYVRRFGPLQARKYDMGTIVAAAVLQGNAVQFRGVRVTDGTDAAASGVVTGTDAIKSVTVGGTAHVGDTLNLNITPNGGSLVALSYVLLGPDTLNTAAIALAALVNGNATLQAAGIEADTPSAGVFNLHYTGTAPTVSSSVTGGGATTTLAIGSPATLSTTQITITGKYTGTLGNSIRAVLSAGSASNTYKCVIAIPGQVPETFDNIPGTGNVFWRNLANAITLGITAIRGPSDIVTATAGIGTTNPAAVTVTLAGGTDGTATITGSTLIGSDSYPRTGMYALRGQGASIAALADVDDSTTWATQVSFGLAEGIYMIGVGPQGQTPTAAASAKASAGIDSYAMKIILGDWVYFNDTVNNQLRLISPQAYSLGILGNLAPNGSSLNKALAGVVGTQKSYAQQTYSSADLQVLSLAGIDVITNPIPRGNAFGFRFGRNSSSDAVVHGDNYTRMTNYIAATLNAGMGIYVGELQSKRADDGTRRRAKVTLDAFMQNMRDTRPTPMIDDFQNILDKTNNPDNRIALGFMQADIKVVYMSVVEFFIVNIEGGQSVSITRQSVQPVV